MPFLFFAWTIIFGHSIVPHHHHHEIVSSECNNCNNHDLPILEKIEIHDCDHECNDHACHFNVEIFTQVSLDNIFIANTESTFLSSLYFVETNNICYQAEFVSDQIPKTKFLRGPPVIS
ncbi:hypothetical protein ACFLS4_05255 [Bacteroidota bacterium]